MSNNTNNTSGGIGFFVLLTILFIGLKLTNYIDWPWWWVVSPVLFPLAIVLFMFAIIFAWELVKK